MPFRGGGIGASFLQTWCFWLELWRTHTWASTQPCGTGGPNTLTHCFVVPLCPPFNLSTSAVTASGNHSILWDDLYWFRKTSDVRWDLSGYGASAKMTTLPYMTNVRICSSTYQLMNFGLRHDTMSPKYSQHMWVKATWLGWREVQHAHQLCVTTESIWIV